MEYEAICCTDKGTRKTVNQDSSCVMIGETGEGQICMALLCDGMGGISLGECASFTVIDCFVDWFENKLPYRIRDKMSLEAVGQEWTAMLTMLDSQLRSYGYTRQIKLGTTATCMLFWKQRYLLVQSGDSRAYCLDKKIVQLSEDQSFVQKQINSGLMTVQEARCHPKRNVLTDCIGGSRPSTPVCTLGKYHGDVGFLLCSDGFVHELKPEEILENLGGSRVSSPEQARSRVKMLVCRAMERGETDNITAVLVMTERQNRLGGRFGSRDTGFLIRKKLISTEGSRLDMDTCCTMRTEE